jgi:hypothetical protein
MMTENDLPGSASGHPSVPYHQEMLVRNADESAAMIAWAAGSRPAYWRRIIDEAFMEGNLDEPHFQSVQNSMSVGFNILWHSQRFQEMEMQFLFDLLKEDLLSLGYKLYMSDVRQFIRKDYVETIQRHYCKPALIVENGKVNQLYGNIILEYRLLDNEPYDLKLNVQYYHDYKYAHPLPYPRLLEALIGQA